jgi:hypothetical protein
MQIQIAADMCEGHVDHADELRVAHEQIAAELQSIGARVPSKLAPLIKISPIFAPRKITFFKLVMFRLSDRISREPLSCRSRRTVRRPNWRPA